MRTAHPRRKLIKKLIKKLNKLWLIEGRQNVAVVHVIIVPACGSFCVLIPTESVLFPRKRSSKMSRGRKRENKGNVWNCLGIAHSLHGCHRQRRKTRITVWSVTCAKKYRQLSERLIRGFTHASHTTFLLLNVVDAITCFCGLPLVCVLTRLRWQIYGLVCSQPHIQRPRYQRAYCFDSAVGIGSLPTDSHYALVCVGARALMFPVACMFKPSTKMDFWHMYTGSGCGAGTGCSYGNACVFESSDECERNVIRLIPLDSISPMITVLLPMSLHL